MVFKPDHKGSGGFTGSLGKCKSYCNSVMTVMDTGLHSSKTNAPASVVKTSVNVITELSLSSQDYTHLDNHVMTAVLFQLKLCKYSSFYIVSVHLPKTSYK